MPRNGHSCSYCSDCRSSPAHFVSADTALEMGRTSQNGRPVGPMDMRCGLTFSATSLGSSPGIGRIRQVSLRAACESEDAGSAQTWRWPCSPTRAAMHSLQPVRQDAKHQCSDPLMRNFRLHWLVRRQTGFALRTAGVQADLPAAMRPCWGSDGIVT